LPDFGNGRNGKAATVTIPTKVLGGTDPHRSFALLSRARTCRAGV